VKDLALHFVGGAAIAALELYVTGSAVLALVWATMLGVTREWDQRPGKPPWRWSGHAWREALAWPVGALCAIAVYALR
jgi:hypothetical protein